MKKHSQLPIGAIIFSAVTFLLLISYTVGLFLLESHINEYNQSWQQVKYIGFMKDESDYPPKFVPSSEIYSYKSEWGIYNDYTYFDTLSQEDIIFYRAFEYALDHGTPYIYIEDGLYNPYDTNKSYVLEYLTMDSAVVDQNTYLSTDVFAGVLAKPYICTSLSRNISGLVLHIESFNEDKLEKIHESVAKAEEILSSLPIDSNSTDMEKAEAIYRYLGKNVKYKDYSDYNNHTFLYDAICKGTSNCDGYANAFALMCHMCDIENFEKTNATLTLDDGHTWNTVLLDGTWYNVDATAAPEFFSGSLEGIPFRFCYSDDSQSDKHRYSYSLPECSEDTLEPDCRFKNSREENISDEIAAAVRNTDKDYVMIIVNDYEEDFMEEELQEVVYELYSPIKYIIVEGNYHTLVFVFPQ